MKFKGTIILLLILVIPLMVMCNPIPYPTIIMPEEHIFINVFQDSIGNIIASVHGEYPFKNVGYENITMYYPVPPKSYNISVAYNETLIPWNYTRMVYPTIIGPYPMIYWRIFNASERFIIKVNYTHHVPFINGSYMLLYAMGTGKYLKYYAKQTTAYVKVYMKFKPAKLEVFAVTENGTLIPIKYKVIEVNDGIIIQIIRKSGMFKPLTEDLLIKFNIHGGNWIPYIPSPKQVILKHYRGHVNVTIIFPHSGFKVFDWGEVVRRNNHLIVNAKIYMWNGPTLPVITIVNHSYYIGKLKPGIYIFTFMVHGKKVKSIIFWIEDWKVKLDFKSKLGSDAAFFGASTYATDGFDLNYDIPKPPPPPPPYVYAYFLCPNCTIFNRLHVDIKEAKPRIKWLLNVLVSKPNTTVTISWNPRELPLYRAVFLKTPDNKTIEMHLLNKYTFNAGLNSKFEINTINIVRLLIRLKRGWNLLSIPIIPLNNIVETIRNKTCIYIFYWNASLRKYLMTNEIKIGLGYWIFSVKDVNITIEGIPVYELNITLRRGWNLIGTPYINKFKPILPENINPIIFTWNNDIKRYIKADEMIMGSAYWIFVNKDVKATLTFIKPKT